MDDLKTYLNLDISYLKDPPKSYQEPAVDLRVRFDDILNSIEIGKYSNEYEFQVDLYNTFNDAHNGHFRFAPDLLSKAVGFRRPVQLVSVSRDGFEVPKIYIRGENFPKALLHQYVDIFTRGHLRSE